MLLSMNWLKGKYIEIFIISVVLLTFWEYVVGVFLEKIFKTKYWDYSDHKIQFQGRICLTNSIAWGFLGAGFINIIHPFINHCLSFIPQNIFRDIIFVALAVMLVDTIVSIVKINTIKDKLVKIQELGEEIKNKVNEIKENSKNKMPDKAKVTENVQLTLEELKSKRNKMKQNLYKYVRRLKDAFPSINTQEIAEVLKFSKKKEESKEKRRKK